MLKETLIKSCHAIWRPFSRLAALSGGSISPVSPAVTRLARRENDSPSDVTASNQHFLNGFPDDASFPVALAWVSICTFVKDGAMPNPATAAVAAALKRAQAPDSPWRTDYLDLSARTAGAFVSIHVAASDALRGCIGTIAPTKPDIPAEIMQNAVHAASEDPRFPPIRASELDGLAINVDILGAAETIRDRITLPEVAALSVPETLDAQRYGVIVSCGWRRGLLLPALDGVDTPLQQATIALNKAGISGSEPFRLQRFEVARYR